MTKAALEAIKLRQMLFVGDWDGALSLTQKLIRHLDGHYPTGYYLILRLYLVEAYSLIHKGKYRQAYDVLLITGNTWNDWWDSPRSVDGLTAREKEMLAVSNGLSSELDMSDIWFLTAICQHSLGLQGQSVLSLTMCAASLLSLNIELSDCDDYWLNAFKYAFILMDISDVAEEASCASTVQVDNDLMEYLKLQKVCIEVRDAIINGVDDCWKPYSDLASYYSKVGMQTKSSRFALMSLMSKTRNMDVKNCILSSKVMDILQGSSYNEQTRGFDALEMADERLNKYDRDFTRYSPLNHLLFISSTFKDMQVERDMLQKDLLPRLRQACSEHGESIEFVDLRWGISTSGLDETERMPTIIRSCLSEVDRCRPHLICLIGNRYGTVLDEELWASSLPKDKFSQLESAINRCGDIEFSRLSLTAAEILYGTSSVLSKPSAPIVCIRTDYNHQQRDGDTIKKTDDDCGHKEMEALLNYVEMLPNTKEIRYETMPSENPRRAYDMRCESGGMPLADRLCELILEDLSKSWEGECILGPFDKMWTLNEHYVSGRADRQPTLGNVQANIMDAIVAGYPIIWIQEQEGSARTSLLAMLNTWLQKEGLATISLFPDAIGECSAEASAAYVLIALRLSLGLDPVPEGGIPKNGSPKEWASCVGKSVDEWQTTCPNETDLDAPRRGNCTKPLLVLGTTAANPLQDISDAGDFKGKHARNETKFGCSKSKQRVVVLVDSVFDIDGLSEIFEACASRVKESPVSFVMTCRSDERATEDGVTIDISNFSGEAICEYVTERCRAVGRRLPDIARKTLSTKVKYQSYAYAELMSNYINSIGADVLGCTRGKDLDSAIAHEISIAPDDTAGLCWRLEGYVGDSVGGLFTDTFVCTLSIGRRGLTKDELQDVFFILEVPWEELSFTQCKSGLGALIKESPEGVLSLAIPSFCNSVIDLYPNVKDVCCAVLSTSICRGLWSSRGVENALRALILGHENCLCIKLINYLAFGDGRDANTLKKAVVRICDSDFGVSISMLLDWLSEKIVENGVDKDGVLSIDGEEGDLRTRGVLSFFMWLTEDLGIHGQTMDKLVIEVGRSTLRLWSTLKCMGVDVDYLNKEGEIKQLERVVSCAEFRSNQDTNLAQRVSD